MARPLPISPRLSAYWGPRLFSFFQLPFALSVLGVSAPLGSGASLGIGL